MSCIFKRLSSAESVLSMIFNCPWLDNDKNGLFIDKFLIVTKPLEILELAFREIKLNPPRLLNFNKEKLIQSKEKYLKSLEHPQYRKDYDDIILDEFKNTLIKSFEESLNIKVDTIN